MNISQPHPDTRTLSRILSLAHGGYLVTEEDTQAALVRLSSIAGEDAAADPSEDAYGAPTDRLALLTLSTLLATLADMPEPHALAYAPTLVKLVDSAPAGSVRYSAILMTAVAVLESARDDEAYVTARGG